MNILIYYNVQLKKKQKLCQLIRYNYNIIMICRLVAQLIHFLAKRMYARTDEHLKMLSLHYFFRDITSMRKAMYISGTQLLNEHTNTKI